MFHLEQMFKFCIFLMPYLYQIPVYNGIKMNKFIKKIAFIIISLLLLFSLTIFAVLWSFSNNIPDYKFLKNYKPPVSSKVYSGNGDLVADFSTEKRIFVPYNSIPKKVINAFLSAEDKNFFSHPGVDAKGVVRASINNIFRYRAIRNEYSFLF